MPQRRAAKKDLRKNKKQRRNNLQIKQNLKSTVKKFKRSVENKTAAPAREALRELQKAFDRAAAKKVIHPNKAARQKSRFSKLLNKSVPKTAG